MKQVLSLLLAGFLAACGMLGGHSDVPPGPAQTSVVGVPKTQIMASDAHCRIGPEGGAVVAERGIGGTGGPAQVSAATQIVEHGNGDIGIVGVITGFASVCVSGLEVRYDDSVAVDVDGIDAAVATLRAGQMVVIQAEGSLSALFTRKISIRHELVGPVDVVPSKTGAPDTGIISVAGQPVLVRAGAPGGDRFHQGDWVSISGLRQEDGTVVATRLEPAARGVFYARGRVVQDGNVTRIGSLVVPEALAANVKAGRFATVSGSHVNGKSRVEAVVPNMLFADPSAYFGDPVTRLMVQAVIHVTDGQVWLNDVQIATAPTLHEPARESGIAVVSMERRPDGSFMAVGLRFLE
jgi:hypothetical protein